ncbi:Zinc fingerC2H2 type family protein [Aphelenchoides avenae]|nr:Zinc fingerC2H2 type family protein [Aphelenchus avenae]
MTLLEGAAVEPWTPSAASTSQDSTDEIDGTISSGTVLGPYAVERIKEDDAANELVHTISDAQGQKHVFRLTDGNAYAVKQISSASTDSVANCYAYCQDGNLFIFVTKAVASLAELNALLVSDPCELESNENASTEPTMLKGSDPHLTCVRCNTVFLNETTLKRHQAFYCKEVARVQPTPAARTQTSLSTVAPSSVVLTPSTTAVPGAGHILMRQPTTVITGAPLRQFPALYAAPMRPLVPTLSSLIGSVRPLMEPQISSNTIVLPVAYHSLADPNAVQLIGPPQTVIPVAIGQTMPPAVRPLLLDANFAPNISLPAEFVQIASTAFNLPLAYLQTLLPTTTVATANASPLGASATEIQAGVNEARSSGTGRSSAQKRKCDSTDSKPLDLRTVKSGSHRDTVPDGRKTLKATTSDERKESTSERPYQCECGVSFMIEETFETHKRYYCKFRPTEVEDVKESPPKSYVCSLCGYKGYSPRGIRAHIRGTHKDEILEASGETNIHVAADALLQPYIYQVTSKTKQIFCTHCGLGFPNQEILGRHQCVARESSPASTSS